MNFQSKIYIAGHRGMVGSAIWRALGSSGYTNLIGRTSSELDLRNQDSVRSFYAEEKPDVVIDAAARVGGILANNNYPYQFLMENMQIQNNLIDGAFQAGIQKFIFLGSSCIYPKLAAQPLKEECLLTASLEPTNEWYALAKISGVKVCEAIRKQFGHDYVSLMPTNLYGYHDNFDLQTSHVLPAMMRKFHEAKLNRHASVQLWGSGTPMREFLFVDDMASAVVFCFRKYIAGTPLQRWNRCGFDHQRISTSGSTRCWTQRKHRLGRVETRRNTPQVNGRFQAEKRWMDTQNILVRRPRTDLPMVIG